MTLPQSNHGHLQRPGSDAAAYDAENRRPLRRSEHYLAGSYTYNADGQRVRPHADGNETWPGLWPGWRVCWRVRSLMYMNRTHTVCSIRPY